MAVSVAGRGSAGAPQAGTGQAAGGGSGTGGGPAGFGFGEGVVAGLLFGVGLGEVFEAFFELVEFGGAGGDGNPLTGPTPNGGQGGSGGNAGARGAVPCVWRADAAGTPDAAVPVQDGMSHADVYAGLHLTAAVIAALESVSMVTFFDEDTPVQLLSELRPQLYVKGGDYDMAQLAETRLVQGYGGRALAIPFVDGFSTTALVGRIRGG